MAILGKPQGIFDLSNSDYCVGSFLLKSDVKEILNVNDNDLKNIAFLNIDGHEVIDERNIQKYWYSRQIPNALPVEKSSLDELLLIAIIKRTFPKILVERQIKIGHYSLDLKLTNEDNKSVFIEFDGPYHFAVSRFGKPKHLFIKKQKVQDKTGIEVINWAYWIQRCSSNVKAIFDNSIKGYGAIWSTKVLFGMFYFEDSAQIIESITKRFNAVDEDGYGYFYGPNTKGRNNPEHEIIGKIKKDKKSINEILPKGFIETNYWLPNELKS
jgi:very-short-patch-repair endonuclease